MPIVHVQVRAAIVRSPLSSV